MLQMLKVPMKSELAPREAALAKLRAIEAVRVDHKIKPQGGGSSQYVIDLYMRTASPAPSMTPTNSMLSQAVADPGVLLARDLVAGRDPQKTVGKMYLEVHAFKDELAMVALSCRCAKRCRLCQNMFEYIAALDKTPPAIVRAFSRTEMKKHEIETLMNAFVGIVVRAQILTTTATTAFPCESDEQIPILVKDFLTL